MARRWWGGEWPKYWGNAAQIASPIVAAVALFGIFMQISTVEKNAAIGYARTIYMSYSEAGLRYPQFVEPDWPAVKNDRVEFMRFKNYVSHMLFAYDEVLAVMDSPEWRAAFAIDLKPLMPYLCEENSAAYDAQFYPKMRGLLADARKQRCGK
jgi:hypothetical protein